MKLEDVLGQLHRGADEVFAVAGKYPTMITLAPDVYDRLCVEIDEQLLFTEIPEDRRALYHAALCHASNHLVTLMSGATHALAMAGVDDPAVGQRRARVPAASRPRRGSCGHARSV